MGNHKPRVVAGWVHPQTFDTYLAYEDGCVACVSNACVRNSTSLKVSRGESGLRITQGCYTEIDETLPCHSPDAAAVPDDTRELVAQLADAIQTRFGLVMPSSNLDFRNELERIAAELRGGA